MIKLKTLIKLLFKPVDQIAGMVGGLLAGLIFKKVWKLIGREARLSLPMSGGAGGKSCWPRCCRARSSRSSRPPSTAVPPRGRRGSPGSGPAMKASSPTSRSDHHQATATVPHGEMIAASQANAVPAACPIGLVGVLCRFRRDCCPVPGGKPGEPRSLPAKRTRCPSWDGPALRGLAAGLSAAGQRVR